jgi:hypothetical protein
MQTRTSFGNTQLVGVRSWIRRGGFAVMMALASIATVGYLLPAHSVEGQPWHSNLDDGGPMPVFVLAGLFALATVLRNKRFGAGILVGVLAPVAAVIALSPVFLAHLLSHVDTGIGEHLFALGEIGLFFGGVVFAIVEPILYVTQRRADERLLPKLAYSN